MDSKICGEMFDGLREDKKGLLIKFMVYFKNLSSTFI